MWDDKLRHLNYMGAVAHYLKLDENANQILCTKAMALRVLDSEDEKSADNAHQMIIDIIMDYDLYDDIDKIEFVTDRGPDIKAALQGYKRHFCLSHLLNNIVKHASESITQTTTSVSKVVKYMKVTGRNNKLSSLLTSYVSTRWNSRYDMFNSFIRAYDEIKALIKKPKIKRAYDSIDIDELLSVAEYLKIYKLMTQEIEGDKEVNFVKILPCIQTLQRHNTIAQTDHPTVIEMKEAAKLYFETNIVHALPKDYKMWGFFNPALKQMSCFPNIDKKDIIKTVTDSISHIRINKEIVDSSNEQAACTSVKPTSIFAALCDSNSNVNASGPTNSAKVEVTRYLEFPVAQNDETNLLQWWNMNQTLFPRLYKKFLELAPIMCCSSSVERLFSHGGNCLTAKRNRLDPHVLEQLVFLNKNKEF